MQLIGVLVILVGSYLVAAGYKNFSPTGLIKELIADPSDLTGTVNRLSGTWQKPRTASSGTPVKGGLAERDSSPGNKSDGLSGKPAGVQGDNGRLPDSQLKKLSWSSQRLHVQAAPSFERLNAAFRATFGRNISVTDGYRTYASQVRLKATKGHLAAKPGTSNHGWGFAVDLGGGINRFGTNEHEWMKRNAPAYGWVNPNWAQPGKGKEEPWHWEFVGSRSGEGGRF